jgi:HNH endonuclease
MGNQKPLNRDWRGTLDVINCVLWPQEVTEGNVYMCPADDKGSYNHQRCEFFGMYRQKRVEQVALIQAVVDLESPKRAGIRWKSVKEKDNQLINRARQKHNTWRPSDYPTRVFLLGHLHPTNFIKDTPEGMRSSKRYFGVRHLKITDAKELAHKLTDQKWSNFSNPWESQQGSNSGSLLSVVTQDIESLQSEESWEGGVSKALVNKYERDPSLRAEAIRIHGTQCQACGFSFEEFYGLHGKDYIEVHHLRPLSSYKGEILVSASTDMAVLCSNCHRMVHRRKAHILTMDELRHIIDSRR